MWRVKAWKPETFAGLEAMDKQGYSDHPKKGKRVRVGSFSIAIRLGLSSGLSYLELRLEMKRYQLEMDSLRWMYYWS